LTAPLGGIFDNKNFKFVKPLYGVSIYFTVEKGEKDKKYVGKRV